jgi:hypothetical protein
VYVVEQIELGEAGHLKEQAKAGQRNSRRIAGYGNSGREDGIKGQHRPIPYTQQYTTD